jgi:hypothetical protein
MIDRSPDLKTGITLATFNWAGTTPVDNDREKMCCNGLESIRAKFDTKSTEIPLTSGVRFSVTS